MDGTPSTADPASDGESDASSEPPPHDSDYQLIAFDADESIAGDQVQISFSPPHSNGGTDFLPQNPSSPRLGFLPETLAPEEDDAEEEREREANAARAFREDESRRIAPLGQENAARIMDAMNGVSFPGIPPDWADQLPEEQWLEYLRRLRWAQNPGNFH
ncbi:uncharacterized protein LOC144706575 [Wolffia australiana]